MMGRQASPERLFYDFCLDEHVPSDHLLRQIDVFVDLESLRQDLRPYYSSIGRPSIDPELMIRMLIIGYCLGIRSERRLCEEVHLNLAYRWFCGLGLDGRVPDHSTFSRNRHGRFRESDLLRRVFEKVVQRCLDEGLVGGEGFAVDASLIQADANKQRSIPGNEWDPADLPDDALQAVKDYLSTLDDAAFGAASEVVPKFISPSDPAAQWTGAHRGPAFFAYATNYLIDTDNAIIVDVEASRAIRQAEVGAARTMIERVMDRFGLYPEHLAGDSAYGAAEMVGWLVEEQGIEPYVAVIDKSERKDGTTMLYRASKADCSVCPLKARCCPKEPARKVPRSIHERAKNMARAIAETDAGEASRKDRKKVEMLFAHLKRILKLGRLRLRGPCGASDEFLLAATAQNLRKLAKLRPKLEPTAALA